MGGFGSLYVGTSGLRMSQNALNTTGHNLANIETDGYTRQQVVQSDIIYNNIKESYLSKSQIGLGTSIAAVRQVRDYFLDAEYRTSIGRQGFYQESYNTMQEMYNYFGELESTQFNQSLQGLWKAVEEVAKQPDQPVYLAALKESAVTFVSRAEAVYKGLADYQVKMNLQIKDAVERINELSQNIYELNIQIQNVELGRQEHANDLRDARNMALDELATYLDINYEEDSTGIVYVRTEGIELISRMNYHKMDLRYDNINGFAVPYWPHMGEERDVFNFNIPISTHLDTDIGSLKALVLARGDHKGTYVDIPVRPEVPVRENYGSDAEFAAAQTQYQTDLADFEKKMKKFDTYTSCSALMNIQAEFDQLFHGIVTAMNDVLCPNKTETIEVDDGAGGTKQMTVRVLDEEKASFGRDGRKGIELFARDDTPRYTEVTDVNGKTWQVYNEEDTSVPLGLDRSTWYSIGKVHVNREVIKDPTCLGFINEQSDVGFVTTGQALINVWSEGFASLNPNILDKSNFLNYYADMMGEAATLGAVYSGSAKAMENSSAYLDRKRSEVTGVSSEEELTNMIKFQSAYNAASRYMTTVSEMMEHLIMSLGA